MKKLLKEIKDNLFFFGMLLLAILPALIVIGFLVVMLYCYIKYGNAPITEIPSWAYFFMRGK